MQWTGAFKTRTMAHRTSVTPGPANRGDIAGDGPVHNHHGSNKYLPNKINVIIMVIIYQSWALGIVIAIGYYDIYIYVLTDGLGVLSVHPIPTISMPAAQPTEFPAPEEFWFAYVPYPQWVAQGQAIAELTLDTALREQDLARIEEHCGGAFEGLTTAFSLSAAANVLSFSLPISGNHNPSASGSNNTTTSPDRAMQFLSLLEISACLGASCSSFRQVDSHRPSPQSLRGRFSG